MSGGSGSGGAGEVRQVAEVDLPATWQPGDYADAFEVVLPAPDPYRPQEWVMAGLASSSGFVKRVTRLLGFGRQAGVEGQVGPWRVVESTDGAVRLETSLPLLDVVLVGHRLGRSGRRLTTVLYYRRPLLARLIWAIIGPVHRRTSRQVLTQLVPAAGDEGAEPRSAARGE